MRTLTLCSFLALFAASALAGEAPVVSQNLRVALDPAEHRIEGRAELTLDRKGAGPWTLRFRLHPDLEIEPPFLPESGGSPAKLVSAKVEDGWKVVEVEVPAGTHGPVGVRYSGKIYDAVQKSEALGFIIGDDTRGVIGEEGVFLVHSSGWYPVSDGVCTFASVEIDVPEEFRAVTQGGLKKRTVRNGTEATVWTSDIPVDGLAMQAGRYVVDTRKVGKTAISTYLFEDQRQHAKFILDQVEKYLSFYEPLLGRYPWPKFDVVSNFFTTGYGMPSYTLLGRNVIGVMVRMAPRYGGDIPPGFVDHELVHCWWGNYVYPDYGTGNWCEGITSYCSNYLMKERNGAAQAAAHRKKICENFAIRVTEKNDYPVNEFRGKTEDFENDIGYGKASMVFHMLRRLLEPNPAGPRQEEPFFRALRQVVEKHGGGKASWQDFEKIFSEVAGEDLSWFFDQWTTRKGAPDLRLGNVSVTRGSDGEYRVEGEILQGGEPWRLDVPIVLRGADFETTLVGEVSGASTPFTFTTSEPPLTLELDPEFQVFRKVPLDEIQPCLNLTLEFPDKVIVVPSGEDPYRPMAEAAKARKGGEIRTGEAGLPDTNCLLFGRPESNAAVAAALEAAGVTVEGNAVTVKGETHEAEDLWLLLSMRHPTAEGKFVTVFFGVGPKALASARLIYHFGWDGFLVYAGRPLARGEFTEIRPRTIRNVSPEPNADRAREIMEALVSPDLGGRLAGTEGDAKTREFLKAQLASAGLGVVSEAPFEFTVKDFTDPDAWTVTQGRLGEGLPRWRTSYPGAVVPAVFSPEATEGVRIRRIANFGAAMDKETLVVLPAVGKMDELLALLGSPGLGGAGAIAIPMEVLDARGMDLLAAYPSRPPKRLKDEKGLWRACAAMQAMAPEAPSGLTVPVVFLDTRMLPPGGKGEADLVLRVRFERKTVKSANLRAVIPNREGRTDGPRLAISAHFDGLGEGHQGADDNTSGVAALLMAAQSLACRSAELEVPVEVILFGAEEWGTRGSAALAPEIAKDLIALVNLDTVGAKETGEIYLIGRSHHPEVADELGAAFEKDGFEIGRDIDAYAFRHGSDHWPFHVAGVRAVDLFSGVYRRMNRTDDVLSLVDASKVAGIASALVAAVPVLAKTALPVKVPGPDHSPVTVFPGEDGRLRNIRRLTYGGENAECYFSPDDRMLCFQSKRGDLKADQIFVMGLDGSGPRMVSNGKGATTCSFLFPGCEKIVYATTAFHGDEPPAPPDRSKGYHWKLHPEFEIAVRNLDGTGLTRLTNTWGYDAECAVSPDGEWIVFTSCRDGGDPEIYKMRADGTEVTRLTRSEGYDGGPFFSPDGSKIIYRANRPETAEEKAKYEVLLKDQLISPMRLELYVMDANGRNQRRITDLGAASFAPYMHPDGKRVLFCSNYGWKPGTGRPVFNIWMVNIDGTGLERITASKVFDGFPMFSFDGRKLVFCSNRDNGGTRETNIFVADWVD